VAEVDLDAVAVASSDALDVHLEARSIPPAHDRVELVAAERLAERSEAVEERCDRHPPAGVELEAGPTGIVAEQQGEQLREPRAPAAVHRSGVQSRRVLSRPVQADTGE
jgi:hypothetical protein